jgi:hypothetical protein
MEKNNHKVMNSYLEANLQEGTALPEKNYYSEEAERHVRCPAAYVTLHVSILHLYCSFFSDLFSYEVRGDVLQQRLFSCLLYH